MELCCSCGRNAGSSPGPLLLVDYRSHALTEGSKNTVQGLTLEITGN